MEDNKEETKSFEELGVSGQLVEASCKFSTMDEVKQYCWIGLYEKKDCCVVHLLTAMSGKSTSIIFIEQCAYTSRMALVLQSLGFQAIPITGQMSQSERLGALNKLKAGECNILVCSDVGIRGLAIPVVDMVINYYIPGDPKIFTRRVGTAREVAISLVDEYETGWFLQLEKFIGEELPHYPAKEEEVLMLLERVTEAGRKIDKIREGEFGLCMTEGLEVVQEREDNKEETKSLEELGVSGQLVEASWKFSTMDELKQYCWIGLYEKKDCYLVHILTAMSGRSTSIIFLSYCAYTSRLALVLQSLGFQAIPITGQMSESERIGALNKLKAGECNILVCSDAGIKGLAIPVVDMVINYNIPLDPEIFTRRVGTARAIAISLVDEYETGWYIQIEKFIGKELPNYPAKKEEVLMLLERVTEAGRKFDKIIVGEMMEEIKRTKNLTYAQRVGSHSRI